MSRELLKAILKGDVAEIDSLLSQGSDITEVTEKERWNYLHRALLSVVKYPTREIVQHLVALGVDIRAVDMYGNTPIHYAARLKKPDLIAALVEAGADVNVVNQEGVSPLRQLFLEKPFNFECVRLLLSTGADTHQKVEGGVSVRELVEIVASRESDLLGLFNA